MNAEAYTWTLVGGICLGLCFGYIRTGDSVDAVISGTIGLVALFCAIVDGMESP
jgi:hypothetical protein